MTITSFPKAGASERVQSEVMRMEGKAAILWFGQVLGTPVADATGDA